MSNPLVYQNLQNNYLLTNDIIDEIAARMTFKQIPAKTVFQRAGEIAKQLYFIEKGIIRHFFVHPERDKEVTTYFSSEGEVVSNSSFFLQRPGLENMESLEKLTVGMLSYIHFEELCGKHHKLEHLVRMIITENLFALDEHYAATKLFNAEERYKHFLEKFPGLVLRVPQIYIASFLGISPETLSRVKSKSHIS